MSKIALTGHASGSGTLTFAAPNTNTDRTLTLPDASGTVALSGGAVSGTTGTFTGLVDISSAAAGQIQFPATQNASANANTLDDYEEGTWTPSVSNMTTTGSPAYGGKYIKIGQQVTIWFYTTTNGGVATYATTANSTGVSGLPFSPNYGGPGASGGPAGVAVNGNTTAGGFIQGPNGSTTFYFSSSIASTQGLSACLTYCTA